MKQKHQQNLLKVIWTLDINMLVRNIHYYGIIGMVCITTAKNRIYSKFNFQSRFIYYIT